MAATRWIGRAQAIAQVDTVTMSGAGDWVTGDTVTLTINDKALVVTVGASLTDADVAITVKEAWENETLTDTTASFTPADGGQDIVEHSLITATVSGDVVTLTADTAGVPFTLVVTETTTGDETATEATATAATGPNFYNNADNWDTGAVPIATDDVYFDNSDVSVLYGLDQSAVAITSLTIAANYTGEIGLPKTNPAGYVEYLGDYLEVDCNTITIGRGDGTGSGRIKLDSGSAGPSVVKVYATGSPAESGLEALLWKGTNATGAMEVISGSVGIAAYGGETATLTTLDVTSGTVRCGAGLTSTTITNHLGTIFTSSNATTITSGGGSVDILGSATVTNLTIEGGTCNYRSSGTATTVIVGGEQVDALIDCSGDGTARTFTTTTMKQNGRIVDPIQTITYTNDIARGANVREITAT